MSSLLQELLSEQVLRLLPARVLLSKCFTGPMIFVSFADANRQLFTGISVFPSLQLKVSIRNPFLKCISVWSKTFDPSSVFLQLVRLKRLSSMMKTFSLLSSVRFFEIIIYDVSSKKRSKTKPVCFYRIKETIKSVLWKIFLKRTGTLLHIHTSSNENVAEFVTKQRKQVKHLFLSSHYIWQ